MFLNERAGTTLSAIDLLLELLPDHAFSCGNHLQLRLIAIHIPWSTKKIFFSGAYTGISVIQALRLRSRLLAMPIPGLGRSYLVSGSSRQARLSDFQSGFSIGTTAGA